MRGSPLLAIVTLLLPFALCARAPQEPSRLNLWAAVAINDPLFQEGRTEKLMIYFALVNDGDSVVDPEIESSKLIINGTELNDSGLIFGNGPRDARWKALPPGKSLLFGYAMKSYFQKPGTYAVSWKGSDFETTPIVFRILPKE